MNEIPEFETPDVIDETSREPIEEAVPDAESVQPVADVMVGRPDH